jgi:hypothetical protein
LDQQPKLQTCAICEEILMENLQLNQFDAEIERAERAGNEAEMKRLTNMTISEMLVVLGA